MRRMPAEWEEHARTFLAWPASRELWGRALGGVRHDVAAIAHAVAEYEPVVMLARPEQADEARRVCGEGIEVVPMQVDDLWVRDTGPVFVTERAGVDLNFNGWGGKQRHPHDGGVAAGVLARVDATPIETPLVGEGGGLETDGRGTLLATESSWVNDNRNPGRDRANVERELRAALGVDTVIWFPGVRGEDITDAHVDALVRFVSPEVVVLNRPEPGTSWARSAEEAYETLKAAGYEIVDLPEAAVDADDDFLASYVNFLIVNGAVIIPRFGDAGADDRAEQVLAEHLPGRRVVSVAIDTLATGGGGIHCATRDQPLW